VSKENELTKIPHQILEEAVQAGMDVHEDNRAGTFFHLNQETIASKINTLYDGKLELMDTKTALQKISLA
jgi:hypothetical protein